MSAPTTAIDVRVRSIRQPATVGSRWMSDAPMTRARKPKTLSQPWAARETSHAARIGCQPPSARTPRLAPIATHSKATPYEAARMTRRGPRADRRGSNVAAAMAPMPTR